MKYPIADNSFFLPTFPCSILFCLFACFFSPFLTTRLFCLSVWAIIFKTLRPALPWEKKKMREVSIKANNLFPHSRKRSIEDVPVLWTLTNIFMRSGGAVRTGRQTCFSALVWNLRRTRPLTAPEAVARLWVLPRIPLCPSKGISWLPKMLQSAAAPTSCLCVPASRKAAVNLTTSRADLARQVPATRGKGSRGRCIHAGALGKAQRFLPAQRSNFSCSDR